MSHIKLFLTCEQMMSDEFELPKGSCPDLDIQDFSEYIIKKHEKITTNAPFLVYMNIINNRLVLKIKDGYKLELQTPDSMKLFSNTKENYKAKQKTENMFEFLN